MGDMKPDRVKLDLDGRDVSLIYSALCRHRDGYPAGPTKTRLGELVDAIGEAAKHAWLAERRGHEAVEYLVGTPAGAALADALDEARGEAA